MRWSPPKPGKRAQANSRARAQVWARVLSREPAYRCEGCKTAGVRLVWAHVMGRPGSGAALGEWANSPELTMKLCDDDPAAGIVGCHSKYDRYLDPDLRVKLLWAAFWRLAGRLGIREVATTPEWQQVYEQGHEEWLKAEIRAMVRQLDEQGIKP